MTAQVDPTPGASTASRLPCGAQRTGSSVHDVPFRLAGYSGDRKPRTHDHLGRSRSRCPRQSRSDRPRAGRGPEGRSEAPRRGPRLLRLHDVCEHGRAGAAIASGLLESWLRCNWLGVRTNKPRRHRHGQTADELAPADVHSWAHPFSSFFSSLRMRQSVPLAMICWGVDLIMPASRRRRAKKRTVFSGSSIRHFPKGISFRVWRARS